jgi:hypothetical protein
MVSFVERVSVSFVERLYIVSFVEVICREVVYKKNNGALCRETQIIGGSIFGDPCLSAISWPEFYNKWVSPSKHGRKTSVLWSEGHPITVHWHGAISRQLFALEIPTCFTHRACNLSGNRLAGGMAYTYHTILFASIKTTTPLTKPTTLCVRDVNLPPASSSPSSLLPLSTTSFHRPVASGWARLTFDPNGNVHYRVQLTTPIFE